MTKGKRVIMLNLRLSLIIYLQLLNIQKTQKKGNLLSNPRKFNGEITEEKIHIIKDFKSSSDLTELRKRYGGPANFYNHLFEQLKNKLDEKMEQIISNNSMEKKFDQTKSKMNKVILKPIEIKDPRLYLPSTTNIKFDINSHQDSKIKINEDKTKLKNKLHLEEIKESDFSPVNEKNKKYSKFAKTTYIDHTKEIEKDKELRNNNQSVLRGPQMNSTMVSNMRIGHNLKLEEMITLKVLKRNKNLGVIKKMLHAPSLRIYTIKEIPIINKEIRNQVKEITEFWKKSLNSNNSMIKIFNIFMNSPEGYCSLVFEYMNNGSLQNLIESAGNLPEGILKNITFQLIKILEIFNKKSNISLGGISPSQILFNKNGTIKICPIYKKIFLENEEYQKKFISNLTKKEKASLKYFNIKMKNLLIKNINDEKIKNFDLFDLGFLLIQCATGCMDIIDFFEYKCEHVDEQKNFTCCCLLHCIEKYEQTQKTKLKITNFINKMNFSEDFTNFLCITTSYNNFQTQITKLKFHSFIRNMSDNKNINTTSMQFKNKIKNNDKYKISLKELLKISNENGGKSDYTILRNNSNKFEKFCETMSLVLPNCESYFQELGISDSSFILTKNNDIKDIMQEFEVDQETFNTKIKNIYDNAFSGFSFKGSNL